MGGVGAPVLSSAQVTPQTKQIVADGGAAACQHPGPLVVDAAGRTPTHYMSGVEIVGGGGAVAAQVGAAGLGRGHAETNSVSQHHHHLQIETEAHAREN